MAQSDKSRILQTAWIVKSSLSDRMYPRIITVKNIILKELIYYMNELKKYVKIM